VFFKKCQNVRIEAHRILETASMSRTGYHLVFGARDSGTHLLAALKRIVELAIHDQYRHSELPKTCRQVAILQRVKDFGDGPRAQPRVHLRVHAEQITAPFTFGEIFADEIRKVLDVEPANPSLR
jgi:hypothetical protein